MLFLHTNFEASCDVLFINYYPFWNGVVESNAIVDLNAAHQQMVDLYGTKPIYVSETGWPSAGDPVGNAVPSVQNASQYLIDFVTWAESGVQCAGYFYFEAYDEAWKSEGSIEGEQGPYWGIWDQYGNAKPNMYEVFEGSRLTNNNTFGSPQVQITYIPPTGSTNTTILGLASGIIPTNKQIAVYIYVGGGWYTKPYYAIPLTGINYDGRWECDVETGNGDSGFTEVAAYLVPANISPAQVIVSNVPVLPSAITAYPGVQVARPP
jgi:hypothetical protein